MRNLESHLKVELRGSLGRRKGEFYDPVALAFRVNLVIDGCPRRLLIQVSSEGKKAGGR